MTPLFALSLAERGRLVRATREHFIRLRPRADEASALRLALLVLALAFFTCPLRANDAGTDFDAANRLYGQGKFREAAAAYQKLADRGLRSETLYFNLGNARFKSGQTGLAIAAWREAEQIRPRDPSVRFNLQFAREQVGGSERLTGSISQRALRALTLNEWTILVSIALWLWFLLLAARELWPSWRKTLSGYTATAGVVLLLLAVCLGAAANLRLSAVSAVVIVPDAVARQSPWEEAQVQHQFRDGTEVVVLDEIRRLSGEAEQSWLQVRDSAGRTGWVKREQLAVFGGKVEQKPT